MVSINNNRVRVYLLFFFAALASTIVSGLQQPSRTFARTSSWGLSSQNNNNNRQAIRLSAGPARLEKEAVRTNGPAVLDRPEQVAVEKQKVKDRKRMGSEAWEVRIYNDGMNTREHVARSLVQITGMSELVAYQTMMRAHQNGIAVVGRWVYEVAEMYHDALQKNGIICDLVPVEEER